MEYTPIILGVLGFLGILTHNMSKLDSINRANDGNVNLRKYLMLERFSIMISVFVIVVAVIASHEIAALHIAGKWLGIGFFALGYQAQSLLVKFMSVVRSKTNTKK